MTDATGPADVERLAYDEALAELQRAVAAARGRRPVRSRRRSPCTSGASPSSAAASACSPRPSCGSSGSSSEPGGALAAVDRRPRGRRGGVIAAARRYDILLPSD